MKQRYSFIKRAKTAFAAFVLILSIIAYTGCTDKEPVSGSDVYLDTQCEISVYGMSKSNAEEIIADAFGEIAKYEKLLSRTVNGSDVDRINRAAGKPVKVSRAAEEAIKAGLEIGEVSDGNFDITVGRITKLWDFKSADPEVPDSDDLAAAVKTVGYEAVSCSKGRVKLAEPKAEIDLGGIAKGYVADRTAEYLESRGVESGIVNLGGNVVTIGCKDDGSDFVIGIERPYSDRSEIIGSVNASDKTVVTSGIYERKFEKDGVLYHHILDPRTGYPVRTDLEAVTIVAEKGNSCFCDGLSTACLMAGADGAQRLVKEMQQAHPEMNIEASFIDKNDKVTQTDGMKINPVQ